MVLWYVGFFLIFSFSYFLLFHAPLFPGQKVLFYRGVELLAVLSAVSLVAGIFFASKTKFVRLETVIASVIMAASIHLAIFIVFPVTFDRSVTMYLLNALSGQSSNQCNGLVKSDLRSNFIQGYVDQQDAIGRRIKEQSVTDFVQQKGSCVSLTGKGEGFVKFSEVVKKVYGLK